MWYTIPYKDKYVAGMSGGGGGGGTFLENAYLFKDLLKNGKRKMCLICLKVVM